jgi:hypothetical protein
VGKLPTAAENNVRLHHPELMVVSSFNNFEKKRFALTLHWYTFHWQRMFHMLLSRSLDLLDDQKVTAEEAADPDPAGALLKKNIRKEILASVARAWDVQFLAPLRAAAVTYQSNPEIASRISEILQQAEPYRALLKDISLQGVTPDIVARLKVILQTVAEHRKTAVEQAADACRSYLSEVISSPTYQSYLAGNQYYFDVPACLGASSFLEESGVMGPIELVRDVELSVSDEIASKLTIEKGLGAPPVPLSAPHAEIALPKPGWLARFLTSFGNLLGEDAQAADGKPKFQIILVQSRNLTPDAIASVPKLGHPSQLGRLGLLKGYMVPDPTTLSLQSLMANLRSLAAMVAQESVTQ